MRSGPRRDLDDRRAVDVAYIEIAAGIAGEPDGLTEACCEGGDRSGGRHQFDRVVIPGGVDIACRRIIGEPKIEAAGRRNERRDVSSGRRDLYDAASAAAASVKVAVGKVAHREGARGDGGKGMID